MTKVTKVIKVTKETKETKEKRDCTAAAAPVQSCSPSVAWTC